MNKRIKRKVTKRVLNKIKNDEPLTKFEKRFFMKYLYPNLKEIVSAVINALKKALPPLIEEATNRVKELSGAFAEAEQANIESTKKLETVNKELYIYTDNEITKAKVSSNFEGMQLVPEEIKESETYFKKIAELDDEAYKDENNKWLGGIDIGSAGKGLFEKGNKPNDWTPAPEDIQVQITDINGELSRKVAQTTFDTLNGTVTNQEIQPSVKETKWQKAKGKLKGWFGK